MIGLGLAYLLCWIPWLLPGRVPMWASLALFAAMGASATGFTLSWAVAKEVNRPQFSGMATSVVPMSEWSPQGRTKKTRPSTAARCA